MDTETVASTGMALLDYSTVVNTITAIAVTVGAVLAWLEYRLNRRTAMRNDLPAINITGFSTEDLPAGWVSARFSVVNRTDAVWRLNSATVLHPRGAGIVGHQAAPKRADGFGNDLVELEGVTAPADTTAFDIRVVPRELAGSRFGPGSTHSDELFVLLPAALRTARNAPSAASRSILRSSARAIRLSIRFSLSNIERVNRKASVVVISEISDEAITAKP